MEQNRKSDYLGHKTPLMSIVALMLALTSEYADYLKPLRLYVAHYNSIPRETSMYEMDGKAGAKWFAKHYYSDIINEYRKDIQLNGKTALDILKFIIRMKRTLNNYSGFCIGFKASQTA